MTSRLLRVNARLKTSHGCARQASAISGLLSSLIKTLDDSDASVRAAAAKALSNFGGPASIEALKKRMEAEESIHVRASLEQALEKLRD
ncbi:MAG: HEAT repeat domain-containing protein [Acidobacteriota bacterium]